MTAVFRRSLLIATAGTLAAPHVARAAARTIRLGHNAAPTANYGRCAQVFAEAVAAHPVLSGVLRIDVRGNAELGEEMALLRGITNGTVPMAIAVTSLSANFVPEVALLDTPFLFGSVERGRGAMDGAVGAEYAELLKAKSINVLAWAENGLRHFTANRPIRTPADLRGLKLRVVQSPTIIANFRALGADANGLPWNEVHEALRTGTFEAQENPIGIIEAFRIAEVQRVLSLTGHVYSTAMILAADDVLEDLTAPQVAALRECAQRGAEQTRRFAETAQREGVVRLRASGMTVVEDVDTAAFQRAAQPLLAQLAERFGGDRVQRLVAAG